MGTPETEYPNLAPHGWSSSFPAFREAAAPYVRDELARFVLQASPEQIRAWDDSIPPLQREVSEVLGADSTAARFTTIIEYQLPLDHRRPDVIFLLNGAVLVLELKGKSAPSQADLDQASAYARDLRAYHDSCESRPVHPVLVATRARGRLGIEDGVHVVGPDAIDGLVAELDGPSEAGPITREEFLDPDRYRPLPSLVEAARELLETGDLRRVRRAAAATGPAIRALTAIAHDAARTRTRHLVLVTGRPGTGKTLVGLQLAHARFLDDLAVPRRGGSPAVPAVYLSGNGPLVEVLQYELRAAGGGGKAFVRDVKSFVERYRARPALVPGEHVIIFDEAQRAWDAAKVARVHGSDGDPGSEPDHLVEFAERIPEWCVVVGLIGGGQEIHDGEESGLAQWREALSKVADGARWVVHAPGSVAGEFAGGFNLVVDDRLELVEELRFHAARNVHTFVRSVLDYQPASVVCRQATVLAESGYHLRITRRLEDAKTYLRCRYVGDPDARFGIVASSRDKDLPRFGVHNDWGATKNVRKGPWFAEGQDDPQGRSCRAMNDCVTEFGCQGLELDAALVAWGSDFMLEGGMWTNRLARKYQSPSTIHDAMQLRVNSYRVLLTRGRDASVVFVPPMPILDETYEYLVAAGFKPLDIDEASGC